MQEKYIENLAKLIPKTKKEVRKQKLASSLKDNIKRRKVVKGSKNDQ